MRNSEVRTVGGIRLEKAVLARGGTREDMALVFDEAPDFLNDVAERLIARAGVVRGDRDCFRFTDEEVVIQIPALKRPTLRDVQSIWDYVSRIESDDSTEKAIALRLSTVLKGTETHIDGKTYERRILKLRADGRLLGLQHRQWLLGNQDNAEVVGDSNVRAALAGLCGKVYIDFPGIIVVGQCGARCIPYALSAGERWYDYWRDLRHGLRDCGRVAVSSK